MPQTMVTQETITDPTTQQVKDMLADILHREFPKAVFTLKTAGDYRYHVEWTGTASPLKVRRVLDRYRA